MSRASTGIAQARVWPILALFALAVGGSDTRAEIEESPGPEKPATSSWLFKICPGEANEALAPAPCDAPWKPFRGFSYVQANGKRDAIWITSTVPARRERNYLLLNSLWSEADVFLEGRIVYSSRDRFLGGYPGLMIPIHFMEDGDALQLRITSPYPRLGLMEPPVLGTEGEILRGVIGEEAPILLSLFFVLSISIVSFLFAFRAARYGQFSVLLFALLTLLMSLSSLLATKSMRRLLHEPVWANPVSVTLFHLWVAAFLLLFSRTQSGWAVTLLRGLSVIEIIAGLLHPVLVTVYVKYGLYQIMYYHLEGFSGALLLAVTGTGLFLSARMLWKRGTRTAVWAGVGGVALALTGLLSYLVGIFFSTASYLYVWGIFLFVATSLLFVKRGLLRVDAYLTESARRMVHQRLALRQERFRTLQNRMSPHFLMNILSTFYALLEQGRTEETRQAIIWLSDHYRFLTDRSRENLIPLDEELAFTENYLQIQRLRFSDHMRYEMAVHRKPGEEAPPADPMIPPLCVQPLVENAVHHGIQKMKGPGRISIHAHISRREFRIEIRDTGPGFAADSSNNRSLKNIKRRLENYYRDVALTVHRDETARETVVSLSCGRRKNGG